MSELNSNHNWYAVITAEVLLSKQLSSTQKLIMALIANLSNEKGYCFASNEYMGECLDISAGTLSNNISMLCEKGWVRRELIFTDKKQVEERRLFIVDRKIIEVSLNSEIPPHENMDTPVNEKMEENNKEFKNKDNISNNDVGGMPHKEKSPWEYSMAEFRDQVHYFKAVYSAVMLEEFYNHWRIRGKDKKMRFQNEEYWDTELRLKNWKIKQDEIDARIARAHQINQSNDTKDKGSAARGFAGKPATNATAKITTLSSWGRGAIRPGPSGEDAGGAGKTG